jgi:exonuclease SbcD
MSADANRGSRVFGMSTREVRVLHTSDVHVGYVEGDGADHRDVCVCAADALADAARVTKADVLLVAGDLFDHARLSNEVVGETLCSLAASRIPVVVVPGNHDVLDETSLWHRCADEIATAGVHLLNEPQGGSVDLLDGALTIWCRAMLEHEPNYRPLADVPVRPDDGWWIVAGHGHYEPDGPTLRSSPFGPEDVASTGADYVALGHWHVRTDVSAGGIPAWYPGSPMGSVSSGTANLVTMADGQVTIDHVPISARPQGC